MAVISRSTVAIAPITFIGRGGGRAVERGGLDMRPPAGTAMHTAHFIRNSERLRSADGIEMHGGAWAWLSNGCQSARVHGDRRSLAVVETGAHLSVERPRR